MGEDYEAQRKKKIIIGFSATSCIVLLLVVIIVAAKTGSSSTDDDGGSATPVDPVNPDDYTCENPMCALYLTKPNFERYTYRDSEKNYNEQFWQDEIFGGPVTEPL